MKGGKGVKAASALRVFLAAAMLLALFSGLAFAEEQGFCTGSPAVGCEGVPIASCVPATVPTCSVQNIGGSCIPRPGGWDYATNTTCTPSGSAPASCHAYVWYCSGGGDCCTGAPAGTCTSPQLYGVAACAWTGVDTCTGTFSGSCGDYDGRRSICEGLGCTWTTSPTCTGAAGACTGSGQGTCCAGLTCNSGICCAGSNQSCTAAGSQAECCGTLACNATTLTCGAPPCGVSVYGRSPFECGQCIAGIGNCTCSLSGAQAGAKIPSAKASADACGYFMPSASTPIVPSDAKDCIGYSTTVPLAQATATQSRRFIQCSTYDSGLNTCTTLDTYVGMNYGQLVTAPIIGQGGEIIGNYSIGDGAVSYAECDPRYYGTMNLTFDPAKVQSVSSVYIYGISADDAWDFGGGQVSYNWACGDECNAAAAAPYSLVPFTSSDSLHYHHYWSIRDRCRGGAGLTATFSITYIPLNTTYQTANLTYPTMNNCGQTLCYPAGGSCTTSPDNCCKAPTVPQDLFCDNLTSPSNPRCTTCRALAGQNCSEGVKCCSPLYCDGSGICQQLCNNSGQSCSVASDCCSPLVCGTATPSVCTCRGVGMPCVDSSYCCGGNFCNANTNLCETRQLPVCSSDSFGDVTRVAGIAGIGMIVLAALVYMAGEGLRNPRMLSWAKGELWEVVFSLVVVSLILFTLSAFCNMQVGEAGRFSSSLPAIFSNDQGKNMYDASLMYLENVAGVGLRNMAQIRSNLGAYEVRTSFQRYKCGVLCFVTLVSTTEATYSGESVDLAVSNNLLGAATVSYLSVLFQYFTLQYIVSGLFVMLLPIAIIVRSVPFMRNFGGALIGIIVALYIMYPLAQLSSAVALPYLAKGMGTVEMVDRDGASPACAGIDVFAEPVANGFRVGCDTTYEKEKDMGGKGISESQLPAVSDLKEGIKTNVLMFLAGIFLPALQFIVIASLARDISGLLGDEADIGRLGQMV